MKICCVLLSLFGLALLPAAMAQSDLLPPQRRAETVALAEKLLAPRQVKPLAENTPSPFAPPGFEQPDPEELAAQQAAAATASAAAGAEPRLVGDRAILEKLSEYIVPSGIARLGGEAILLFGQKKLKVGDRLTITFDGSDYELDITAIDRTTFTLRYHREEITRSIKPGNQP